MKARIRRKGMRKDGTNRHCIEYIDSEGEFRAIELNPNKVLKLILDSKKNNNITKEKEE